MAELQIPEVCKDISPDDDMWTGDGKKWYFEAGQNGLKSVLLALGEDSYRVKRILDIPCGYGRVLRFLAAYFKTAEIVACDLNRKAVDFCERTFGVKGVYSDIDFSKINIDAKFDLIWCGSLLTHFNDEFWDRFLRFATSLLAEDGLFVFTTHGRIAAYLADQKNPVYGLNSQGFDRVVSDYKKTGFGYVNYSDLHPHYGISLASPAWIAGKLQQFSALKIVSFREHAWGHQDVWATAKTPPVYIAGSSTESMPGN